MLHLSDDGVSEVDGRVIWYLGRSFVGNSLFPFSNVQAFLKLVTAVYFSPMLRLMFNLNSATSDSSQDATYKRGQG